MARTLRPCTRSSRRSMSWVSSSRPASTSVSRTLLSDSRMRLKGISRARENTIMGTADFFLAAFLAMVVSPRLPTRASLSAPTRRDNRTFLSLSVPGIAAGEHRAIRVEFGGEPVALPQRMEELHHRHLIAIALASVCEKLLAQFVVQEDHAAL